jgi:alpha-ribazole phosphatase/probable phosphoglycerate mutase
MTAVWLIRHAEPDAAVHGRCYGLLDASLSQAGREQAASLALRLAAEPFAAIYSSPRLRAIETAKAIATRHRLDVVTAPGFRELHFGDFEGRTYSDIAATHPELYRQWMDTPTEVRFPNGESFAQMRVRVLDAHRALLARHGDQTVGIIAHGGVIRIILADALGIPGANIFRIAQRYAALNLIRYFDGSPSIELMNAS